MASGILLAVGLGLAACPPARTVTEVAGEDCGGSVDVVHHDVALKVAPAGIVGTGELRLRATRRTRRVGLEARGLKVSQVSERGRALPFTQDQGELCVELPAPVEGGAEIALHVGWSAGADAKTPHFEAEQVWAGYDAAAWMPTRMDPAQRATLALKIDAPPGMKVVTARAMDRASPPFLYAFAVGRFDEAELVDSGVTLRAFGPKGADLAGALAVTAPMLRFLVAHTGAPFPAAEYVQVFVKGEAAQEAAGLSLIDASALDDVRADPHEDWVFAHELAHQWFAWLVPCADFSDFWLNEGFATFLVAAIKEARWGRPAYEREVGLWRERSAKVHAQGKDAPLSLSDPRSPRRAPPTESGLQPRGVTYSRGALVLHKLRGELGDAVFWEGVRRYVKTTAAGRGARSEDLRVALEAASGRDLRAFFARWVYAAAPDL